LVVIQHGKNEKHKEEKEIVGMCAAWTMDGGGPGHSGGPRSPAMAWSKKRKGKRGRERKKEGYRERKVHGLQVWLASGGEARQRRGLGAALRSELRGEEKLRW